MDVEDSYKTSLRLATLDQDGPSGGFSMRMMFYPGKT